LLQQHSLFANPQALGVIQRVCIISQFEYHRPINLQIWPECLRVADTPILAPLSATVSIEEFQTLQLQHAMFQAATLKEG